MPYIKDENRKKLDDSINKLAQDIANIAEKEESDGSFAGLLNYSCTRLALEVVRLRFKHIRYWIIAMVAGVFGNVSSEFYRRLASPYEDKQIKNHGDVDLYEEFLKDIQG